MFKNPIRTFFGTRIHVPENVIQKPFNAALRVRLFFTSSPLRMPNRNGWFTCSDDSRTGTSGRDRCAHRSEEAVVDGMPQAMACARTETGVIRRHSQTPRIR